MLDKLKITTRLVIGFGLLVTLIVVSSALAVWQSSNAAASFVSEQKTATIALGLKDTLLSVRQGRVMVWTYAATGDAGSIAKRDDAFAQFKAQIANVEKQLKSPEGKQLVKAYTDAVMDFEAKAVKMNALKAENIAPTAPDYLAAISDVNAAASRYADTNAKATRFYEEKSAEAATRADDQIQGAITSAIAFGLVAVLVGIAAALIIGRGIARPIGAMTGAMRALAGGDLSVAVPSLANADEIGDMAKAVEVFKENAVRARTVAGEQEAEHAARERRTQTIDGLTKSFDQSVSSMLERAATTAADMQGAVTRQVAIAAESETQLATVASASEQATANVQTVASAAEELSASISEIARQVASAARISASASDEAANTNTMVEALAVAAGKIGDVVSLINDIAAQTNLLALNATMSCSIKQRQFA